jgi:hypothetical protein
LNILVWYHTGTYVGKIRYATENSSLISIYRKPTKQDKCNNLKDHVEKVCAFGFLIQTKFVIGIVQEDDLLTPHFIHASLEKVNIMRCPIKRKTTNTGWFTVL